jgi:hypothetical protein
VPHYIAVVTHDLKAFEVVMEMSLRSDPAMGQLRPRNLRPRSALDMTWVAGNCSVLRQQYPGLSVAEPGPGFSEP